MPWGEFLTRWTVRAALGLYIAGLFPRIAAPKRPAWRTPARWAWTIGCVVLILHIACAFHFFHDWDHQEAYAATARRTKEVVGLDWGGGLYVNYAFALVWVADLTWWWSWPEAYEARPAIIEWTVQGFLAFIAFHATVVFGVGAIRWWASAATLLLAVLLAYRFRSHRPPG
jgi:hypothetical protein